MNDQLAVENPPFSVISAIRKDVNDLNKYFMESSSIIIKTCRKYLLVLEEVIVKVILKKAQYFGVEVFLADLENLYRVSIQDIKSKTNNFSVDLEQIDYKLFDDLLVNLGELSYITMGSDGICIENTKFIGQSSSDGLKCSTSELDNYLNVGQALKDDEVTQLFIEEIERLHLDGFDVSPFMSIVGPSYMGKTQTAFTLSHKIDLIYVNFPLKEPDEREVDQPIYSLFEGLADIFEKCIADDINNPEYKLTFGKAEGIRKKLTSPLQTLGLIYVLFRCHELQGDIGINDWLRKIVMIKNAIIPCMTICEFRSKLKDLKNKVVFIDELTLASDEDIIARTRFLRNLCRAVRLPCILSGTNSNINNLIGRPSSLYRSRVGNNEKPWVQVMVKTPKASLHSFCRIVQIDNHGTLQDYLRGNDLDYERIFINFYGKNGDLAKFAPVKRLIQFLVHQSSTSLPGLIPIILEHLFRLLPIHKDDISKLWLELVDKTSNQIKTRKNSLITLDGLLASAHILVFESSPEKQGIEEGNYSATFVEKHLFHYGARDEVTFRLNLGYNEEVGNIGLYRDKLPYSDKCNFPELEKDFFTTFLCLNMWQIASINKVNKTRGKMSGLVTLAGIYQKYLEESFHFKIDLNKSIPDSASLEILAHWSICFASHQNCNGKTGGMDVFIEFAKQLQPFTIHDGPVEFNGLSELPEGLESILSRIKVPYLMRFPKNDPNNFRETLHQYLGDFIKFGKSYMPPDSAGKDIVFDLNFDGVATTGMIECKLWKSAIGLRSFFKYYKKACDFKYPLSFLVCRKIVQSIDFPPVGESQLQKDQNVLKRLKLMDFDESKFEETIEENEEVKEKKIDYMTEIKKLWECSEENHIEIYAVRFNTFKSTNANRPEVQINQASFSIQQLKAFDKPKGVFILVQSNFNAPDRAKIN